MKKSRQLFAGIMLLGIASSVHAVTISDPGFESYNVASGGFTKAAGPWGFSNDAGVVEPFSPNSSNGVLDTWSATFAAFEGEQYASTYAGLDTITQSVNVTAGGTYIFKIYAAAPDGTVLIPPNVDPSTLTTGLFSFTLDSSSLGSFSIDPGTDWTEYSFTTTIAAGVHAVGIVNTAAASYFINYDNFSLSQVPVPAAAWLFGSGLLGLIGVARRKKV